MDNQMNNRENMVLVYGVCFNTIADRNPSTSAGSSPFEMFSTLEAAKAAFNEHADPKTVCTNVTPNTILFAQVKKKGRGLFRQVYIKVWPLDGGCLNFFTYDSESGELEFGSSEL